MVAVARLLAAAAASLLALSCGAAPTPDRSFAGSGLYVSEAPLEATGFHFARRGLAADRLGRVLVAYTHDCGVHAVFGGCTVTNILRLLADGTPDLSVGPAGVLPLVATDTGRNVYTAVAVDAMDRIVGVHGWDGGSLAVRRFLGDGHDDPTFGTPPGLGVAETILHFEDIYPLVSVATQPDGRIVLALATHAAGTPAGQHKITLVRLDETGALDRTFGAGTGVVLTAIPGGVGNDIAADVAIQPDGRIVVAGSTQRPEGTAAVVLRYLEDGSPDVMFGLGGIVVLSAPGANAIGMSLALLPDGRMYVSANLASSSFTSSRAGLTRLKPDGFVDGSLGPWGWSIVGLGGNFGLVQDMALQADGKPVVSGFAKKLDGGGAYWRGLALRYDAASGRPDPGWDHDGRLEIATAAFRDSVAIGVAVDGLGRVLVSGTLGAGAGSRLFVARLIP